MNDSIRLQTAEIARPNLTRICLAIALLGGQLIPAQATINDSIVRQQAQQIVAQARGKSLTLGMGEDLAVTSVMTTKQGRTVVHATQTYQGHRVWGSGAVIHASSTGNAHIAAHNLSSAPAPKNPPLLTQAQATAIAMKLMANKGPAATPKTELVIFPTKHHGGIATMLDPLTHKYVVDYSRSVMSLVPSDPYVWAYEVHGFAKNSIDKIKDMIYVVDARTGAIIHIESGLHLLAPLNPPTQYATDSPAIGVGNSQYSGTVSIGTTQHADGSFALVDTARGTQPNPYLAYSFLDPNTGQPVYDANGNPISALGLETATETHAGFGFNLQISMWWYDGYPSNNWGDGNQFVMFPFGGETTTNGQTAAVDAQYGMATTWDFYQNVFGMNGIDGQGSSPLTIVHSLSPTGYYGAYAAWSEMGFQLVVSDGDRDPGPDSNGNPTPPNPAGHGAMTSIDIIGHELTHSVINNTAALTYSNESGMLDEGTADIFGQMIEAYAKRPTGADTFIPATGNDWLLGSQTGTPFRNFMQPSSDNIASDNWYDGIKFLDLASGSGPLTRWFYFLSQGASNVVGSACYSPYLPGGMTGIGNDHAARIWFQALSNYLLPDSAYADARVAAISAATDLYGAGSADVAAVKSAFAAINVGGPTDAPRITITMPVVHSPNSIFLGQVYNSNNGTDLLDRIPIVAMTTSVQLQAQVQNTTNTAVTWTIGGRADDIYAMGGIGGYGGVLNADGSWSPNAIWGFHSMTATSVADPLQYAEGSAWVVNGDADSDNEFDAIDLGSVALSWGLNGVVKSTHSLMNSGFTNSYDVAAIVEAFKNAFGGI